MCGFFGLLDFSGKIADSDINEIRQGSRYTTYRGPDDNKEYHDKNFVISFNRLSILDVNAPSQPLVSEDNNLILVCNGEIYNFKELRNELKKNIILKLI